MQMECKRSNREELRTIVESRKYYWPRHLLAPNITTYILNIGYIIFSKSRPQPERKTSKRKTNKTRTKNRTRHFIFASLQNDIVQIQSVNATSVQVT